MQISKIWGKQDENGSKARIRTLKLQSHFTESRNLTLYKFAIKYDILIFLSKILWEILGHLTLLQF